ncbi:PREDICTED: translocase of chloroplast 159, chloroplastic-like isoform X1 [Lupinus angustifolius]|uniref:translocase of chloroplast 159, chloroplastic-like isoform X1 n=1 Tax=Lupinus angustifolius TaxID=3871 RepID=UPI00092ED753|nr:PREDICTED: translocase of chloroplast 159, chloroplastic-like isoform X1 [Lupinus angustifolius]
MDSHSSLYLSDQSLQTSSTDHNLVNGSESDGDDYDDDFDTEPPKPILVPPYANYHKSQGFVDDPSLSFTPKSQFIPIAKVTLDDDVSEEEEEDVFVEASTDDNSFQTADFEGGSALENGVDLHDDGGGVDNNTLSGENGNSDSLGVGLEHDDDKSKSVVENNDDVVDKNDAVIFNSSDVVDKNDGDVIDKNDDDVVDKNVGDVVDKNVGDVVDKNDGDVADKNDGDVVDKNDGDVVDKNDDDVVDKNDGEVVDKNGDDVVDKNDDDVVDKNDGEVVDKNGDDVVDKNDDDVVDKNDGEVVDKNGDDVVDKNDDDVVDKNDGEVVDKNGDDVVDKNDDDVVDKNDGEVVDKNGDDVVDKNDGDVVKFNSDGDPIVESVQVNVSEPSGVTVVGDKLEQDEEKESEIKGVEVPALGISLDNGFNPIEQVGGEDVLDNDIKVARVDTESSQIVDTGVDDVKNGDVAPLQKDESVEAVQDDRKIEGHADEGGNGTNTEESEIEGVEAPAPDISLDNGFSPIEQVGGEDDLHNDNKVARVDAESRQIVDTGDDDVKNSGIAPLQKDESLKAVQDDIDIEGHAIEGGNGANIEESAIEGVEALACGISLTDEFDPPEQLDAADVFYRKIADVDAESGHNAGPGVDDDDSTGYDGHKNDIAPLEGHVVQDDVNIEAHAHAGEVHRNIEAFGEVDEEEYGDDDKEFGSILDRLSEINFFEKQRHGVGEIDGSVLDSDGEEMNFRSFDAPKNYSEEEEQHGVDESTRDQRIDGQIVTDSDEEVDTDDDGGDNEMFDSATLEALLKAASGAGQDGGNITITSQDGSRLFSVDRPSGLGPSLLSGKPVARPNRANFFAPSINRAGTDSDINLSKEEKDKLEKLQQIRIKFLRLVQRLGFTTEESIAAQVLYRLTLVAGRQTGQIFNLDAAKESASQLEADGRDDLNYSITILVLGKTGVGKSATINSIFGETKTSLSAYGPATTKVTEIIGMVDGVKIRVFDTPGLKSSALEQNANRKVLSMIKKMTKKSPPDIVLYVDRLDLQTRDLNDLPLLKSITSALGPSIWRNVIVSLTHGASAPPDGPSGAALTYDVFVAQNSHIVQQTIGHAVGDLRLMNPNLMTPVSLVENHASCRKNRGGQKVLPNGQPWRPLLLLLCHSMKILSEAGNLSKPQEPFDQRRLFGFRTRSPPLPYLLSWLLQSRTHPKLSPEQGGVDNGDSDVEADLSDSDLDEDEDEYDQLPPFKPLRKAQFAKLNKEQQKAYLEEYEYRVKLLQKKQLKDELRRMRDMKKKGKTNAKDYGYPEDGDQENEAPAAVPVPLPDMALPPSFDSDNPAYRYRFLEPTSQLLTRPVLDTQSWDHDCGYDGVNLEQTLAIINKFPAAVSVQITKDKKDFNIHLDSSVAAKHGENGSTLAGFDIQNIGQQLAYIVRGETKFKNFKRNKTAAGLSVTFLGENVSTGLKVEDQIALGKRLVLVGSTGTVRCQGDSVYGANVEVRLREADFPIGQDQSSLSLSLVKWRGDLALGANFQSQFSLGRSYKMGVRAGLNNKLSGQISVRTSSSDQLQIALIAILPIARAIYKNFWTGASEDYSIY